MSMPRTTSASTTEIVVPRVFRVRWGAVFAGLVLAMTVQLILTVVGSAIGLAAWDPSSGKGLGIGAGIWALLTMLISLFLGGGLAGYGSGFTKNSGMLHGLLVGALGLLFTTWMIGSGIGAIAGTTFSIVGNAVGATAGAAVEGASSSVADRIQQSGGFNLQSEIETLLRQTGNPAISPESLRATAEQGSDLITQSSASNADVAREISDMFRDQTRTVNRDDLINVIAARTGKSHAEAEQMADRVMAAYNTASAKLDTFKVAAADKAEDVASATSKGLWLALVGMVLSLAVAAFGGAWGVQRTEDYVIVD